MPNPIQLLPPHIANQIAAGEVIQRPASAVKELLENAVDAGATEIKLVVVDAGKSLLQVIDNGRGMDPVDARNCFERHATSKINVIEDLFTIKTMGFRGEALASIAAVAQVSMKTKTADQELGTAIEIENYLKLKDKNQTVVEAAIKWIENYDEDTFWIETYKKIIKFQEMYPEINIILVPWSGNQKDFLKRNEVYDKIKDLFINIRPLIAELNKYKSLISIMKDEINQINN